jgi:hypothetical protein
VQVCTPSTPAPLPTAALGVQCGRRLDMDDTELVTVLTRIADTLERLADDLRELRQYAQQDHGDLVTD